MVVVVKSQVSLNLSLFLPLPFHKQNGRVFREYHLPKECNASSSCWLCSCSSSTLLRLEATNRRSVLGGVVLRTHARSRILRVDFARPCRARPLPFELAAADTAEDRPPDSASVFERVFFSCVLGDRNVCACSRAKV